MNKLKAIIIDDEASARENLELLLKRFCLQVNCVRAFNSLDKGVNFLKKNSVDLVFLDVDMPNYAGYEIVNFFQKIDFQIVFVTAYNEFALKAFEISAVDYLLKPIDIERLKEAVLKVEQKAKNNELAERYREIAKQMDTEREPKISLLDKGSRIFIPFKEIVAVEAQAAYSTVYTLEGKKYLCSKNISSLEKEFDGYRSLFRSHKSWIVNTSKITEFRNSQYQIVLEGEIIAKISRYKVGQFKALME